MFAGEPSSSCAKCWKPNRPGARRRTPRRDLSRWRRFRISASIRGIFTVLPEDVAFGDPERPPARSGCSCREARPRSSAPSTMHGPEREDVRVAVDHPRRPAAQSLERCRVRDADNSARERSDPKPRKHDDHGCRRGDRARHCRRCPIGVATRARAHIGPTRGLSASFGTPSPSKVERLRPLYAATAAVRPSCPILSRPRRSSSPLTRSVARGPSGRSSATARISLMIPATVRPDSS